MICLKGKGVSDGYGIGTLRLYNRETGLTGETKAYGTEAFEKARAAAQNGDYAAVKKLMEPLMKDEKTAALVESLQRKQDSHG